MGFVIFYVISVILAGGAMYAYYLDHRDSPMSNFEMFLAIATPLIPILNLLVLLGLVDQYMNGR